MRFAAPTRCNCLIWALCRFARKGGYVAMRRSRFSRWKPHFVWSADARHWWGYVPLRPRHGGAAFSHGLWFRGHVVREEPLTRHGKVP